MLRAAWQFRSFLGRFMPPLGWGMSLLLLGTFFDLLQPWPLKVIIDGGLQHKPQSGFLPTLIAGPTPSPNIWNGHTWVTTTSSQTILVRALVAMAIIGIISAVLDYASNMLMDRAGERVVVKIRTAVYGHVQRLSLAFHNQQRVGDLVSRVTTDIDRVQSMVVAMFDTLIPNIVLLVGLAAVMLWIDPPFGLLALSIAPPLFFVTYRYTNRIKGATRRAREADSKIAAHATETLAAVRSVQAFNRESYEDERFNERNLESLSASLEAVRLRSIFSPLVDTVSLCGTILITYVGVRQVLSGSMTLGLFLVFIFYLNQMYRPMRALSKMTYVVSRGTTSADRVQEILKVEDRVPQRPDAVEAPAFRGLLEIRDVTFRYEPGLEPVLEHASLTVQPGEHVGIVGRTGAGKSTLVSLIPRFYDPDSGGVYIDGTDIREFTLPSVRQQISLVLQDAVIFRGTILDNIRYGDPEAPIEKVWDMVKAAHVDEFLGRLPDGIETVVGERGTTLSGGQRQRIAIARAMLADAPILILDEPTTGLDGEAEALVLDGLERLSQNRTAIVISHQKTTLRDVTRTVRVVDGGLREVSGSMPLVVGEEDDFEMAPMSPADGNVPRAGVPPVRG
jgi:subfamily B ATP-binding cassette protein MsbA